MEKEKEVSQEWKSFVEGIAKELGFQVNDFGGWSYRDTAQISDGDKKLFIQTIWNKPDRIKASGCYPSYICGSSYYGDCYSITVSKKKTSVQVAKDITNRLLNKGYLEVLDRAKSAIKKDADECEYRYKTLKEVADYFGVEYKGSPQDVRDKKRLYVYGKSKYVESIEMGYEGLNMKLKNLDAEKAKKVIDLVKSFPVDQEEGE